jgi:hypothetical protein
MTTSAIAQLRGWLRDGWIALGIALLMFFALEGVYRGLQRLRHGPPPDIVGRVVTPGHPYAGQAWFAELKPGLDARKNRFDPYRSYWPGPVKSKYVNIDSAGRRITPQPVPDTAGVLHVLMLGGSTMWGFTARDSFTIPALTAARLAAHGVPNVHVENLAQAAFNTTQEASTLMLEVARGRIPDAVVLLDGYNDVATALKYRDPGHTYGEENTSQQIELGRRTFWQEFFGFGRYSSLISGLKSKLAPDAPPPPPRNVTRAQICGEAARYYAGIAHQVEAIGQAHSFPVVYFHQPLHSTSGKPLSTWERGLPNRPGTRECADSIEAVMADRAGRSYVSLRGVFDADTATRFEDEIAHITETANGEVAERIAQVIAPLLQARTKR